MVLIQRYRIAYEKTDFGLTTEIIWLVIQVTVWLIISDAFSNLKNDKDFFQPIDRLSLSIMHLNG